MSHPERPVRLRYLLKPREETGQPHREVLSVYREHGVVPKSSRDDNFNKTPTDLSRFQVVHVGDLVVNKMKAWQGSIAVSRYGGIVSPDYLVCSVSSDIHAPYLHYLLRSNHLINEFRIRSKGIRPAQWRLYWEDLAEIRVQLPHLDKQRRIADFLDAETARIDQASAAMRQQVRLLTELRLRAIDSVWPASSDVPMMRLGYGTQLVTSGSRGWAEFVGDSGALFFRSANLHRDSLRPNLTSLAYVQPSPSVVAEASRSRISKGDVLVGITGANTGWVALADDSVEGGNVSQHVCLVRPVRGDIDGQWLAYLIASPTVQTRLMGSQYGGTKTQLSLPDIRDIRVPVVSIRRQQELAARVDGLLRILDRQRELRNRQFTVLAERRQALITAVVTGQIDVSTANGRDIEGRSAAAITLPSCRPSGGTAEGIRVGDSST